MQREFVSLERVASRINAADLLLFRAKRPLGRAIAIGGRGEWCHGGMAACWGGDLFLLEVREWYGGRIVMLEREVARRPEEIDVFGIAPGFHAEMARFQAVATMRRMAGASYGWFSVLRASLLHLPLARICVPPLTDDEMENGRPPFCTQALSYAYRKGGGIDPLPNLADAGTEPSDLARSPVFHYRFTLRP